MKTTLKIAALLAGLASAPVHASAPMPQTVVTAVTGDCTNADVRPGMTPLPNDRIAFGLNFENRTLQALDQVADGNQVGATCDLTVEVQVPHGYRLKIDAFALEGYLRATGQNYVGIEADYDARHGSAAGDRFADMNFWLNPRDAAEAQGDDRLAPGSLLGAPQGPWAARYDLTRGHDQMMASDCGETVVLHSALYLHAMKVDDQGGPANLALFKDDQSGRVEWGWQMESCGDTGGHDAWFQGPWHSRYSVNNQWVQAGLNFFDRHGGQYTTSSWTGDLAVERFDDREVSGTWRAQGEQGWFSFQRGQDGRSFHGRWGRQQGFEQGSWSGER